jgi:cellobiose-specific phosphotransferase system component IIA
MTQSGQPESLESRVSKLEAEMTEIRASAEALLQIAQIHQQTFEALTRRQVVSDQLAQTHQQNLEALTRRQAESDQRFEILLADAQQDRLEQSRRFDEMNERLLAQEGQIKVLLERLLGQ